MEVKKNPKANLEEKRGVFFMMGLVIVLAIVLIAFENKTYDSGPDSLGQLKVMKLRRRSFQLLSKINHLHHLRHHHLHHKRF